MRVFTLSRTALNMNVKALATDIWRGAIAITNQYSNNSKKSTHIVSLLTHTSQVNVGRYVI